MTKQHKWHKEIKAWADGTEIEFKELGKEEWNNDDDPEWCDPSFEFRIKPQPKEPEYIIVKLDNEGCKLIFQHLFDKGLRGEYKIILEKINE